LSCQVSSKRQAFIEAVVAQEEALDAGPPEQAGALPDNRPGGVLGKPVLDISGTLGALGKIDLARLQSGFAPER
jgi:hypothetical protein